MVDPVVTGALVWLVQRLLDKGFDRIFDALDAPKQNAVSPFQPMVATRRHDLSVEGAQGTSDLDVDVRAHLLWKRSPVILTFQKFGTTSGGATLPMVLGDTAHLTLRRDHYLIAALVVALPNAAGAKPTLRGVGWSHEWVADNHVRQVTITTRQPTTELVRELGLTKSDGSCPFILAPPPAATPGPAIADAPVWRRQQGEPARTFFQQAKQSSAWSAPRHRIPNVARGATCRARTGMPNERCGSAVHADKLCRTHWNQVRNGHPVHDFETGWRLWTT